MFHRLRVVALAALLLTLCEVTTVGAEAVTLLIGSEYVNFTNPAVKDPLKFYTTGLEVAVDHAPKSSLVSYGSFAAILSEHEAYNMFTSFAGHSQYRIMFGPVGRVTASLVFASMGTLKFPCFAPFSESQTFVDSMVLPAYREQVYWTIPSSHAQAIALLHYLSQFNLFPVQQYSLRTRYSFVCDTVQFALPKAGSVLGAIVGAAMYNSSVNMGYIKRNKVRVLYINTQTEVNANASIHEFLTGSLIIDQNITFCTSFELAYMTLEIYNDASAKKVKLLPPENILLSMPVPGVEATEYHASQIFSTYGGNGFGSLSTLKKDIIMAGWANSVAVIMAQNKYIGTNITKKEPFYNNLLAAQSSFLVEDLFIGSFGPTACSKSMTWSQGAVCSCHTGGNNVWYHTFTKKGNSYDTVPLRGALFQYGLGMCANIHVAEDKSYTAPNTSGQILRLARTVHLVGMGLSGASMTADVCNQMHGTISRVANTTLFWHHSLRPVRGYCLSSTLTTAPADFISHNDTYVTSGMMGVIPDSLLKSETPPTEMILDFIPQTTQPRLPVPSYVYLFSTLDQELSVLVSYLSKVMTASSGVCGVIRESSMSSLSAQLISDTLRSYGVDTRKVREEPSGSLVSNIPVSSCAYTIVVDAGVSDVALLGEYLESNPTATLLVPFDDITKHYSEFVSTFGSLPASVTNRLLFATNLPTWTGSSMTATEVANAEALSTVEEFVQTLAPIDQTPAAARAFVVAMLYDRLTRRDVSGLLNLQSHLYAKVTLAAGGMTFGPFTTTWAGAEKHLINYGASGIAVWSFTRVVVPATPLLAPPVTPSLVYIKASAGALADVDEAASVSASSSKVVSACFSMQASSSLAKDNPGASSSASSLGLNVMNSTDVSSSSSSSSLRRFLNKLQDILIKLLLVVAVYIVLLLIVLSGALVSLWRLAASSLCVHDVTEETTAANKFRLFVNVECNDDVLLQHAARSASLAPDDTTEPLTFVFVEVDNWRALWVHEAAVMSRAVRHYQRCVREAVVRHGCYEMMSVEGIFVVACASVDAGVNAACDLVRDVASLATCDANVVHAAYARWGCRGSTVPGLHLRVAVHCGVSRRHVDASGGVMWGGGVVWSGGALENAVRAAYSAGGVGLVVVTASAKKLYTGTTHLLPCGHLGSGPEAEELFAACVVGAVTARGVGVVLRRKDDDGASAALLLVSENWPATRSGDVCKESLERHYDCIPECHRIDDLAWMFQRFGLPVLPLSEDADEHSRYVALLNAVSGHLGSLMECRHGLPRRSGRVRSRVVFFNDCDNNPHNGSHRAAIGTRFSSNMKRSHSSRHLRHFSYVVSREEEESSIGL